MTPDERRGESAPAGAPHPAAGPAPAIDDPDPGIGPGLDPAFDLGDLLDSDRIDSGQWVERARAESAAAGAPVVADGGGPDGADHAGPDASPAVPAGPLPSAPPAAAFGTGPDAAPAADAEPETEPETEPESKSTKQGTIWEQMGGVTGMVDSALPVVVFVVANAIGGLGWGIGAAIATAIAIAAARIARKRPVTNAIAGVFGVAVAAFIAYRTGSAKGYFLLGIWSYLLYGGALLLSVLVRWPLVGVIWEGINGRGTAWRADRRMVRRYDYATLIWVAVFALRYLVQNYLYDTDQVGWLAVFRVAMGFPLFVVAGLATIWIVAGTTKLRVPRGGLRGGLGGLARGSPPPPPAPPAGHGEQGGTERSR